MGGKYTNYLGYLSTKELKNLWATHQPRRQRLLGDTPRSSLYSDGGDPAGAGLETPSLPAMQAQVAHPAAGGNGPPSAMSHASGVPQRNGHRQGTPSSHLGTGTRQELREGTGRAARRLACSRHRGIPSRPQRTRGL